MVADFIGALGQGLAGYQQGRLRRRDEILARRQQEFQNQLATRAQDLAEKQVEQQWKQFRTQLAAADRRFQEEMAFRRDQSDEEALRWSQSFMLQTQDFFERRALNWAKLQEDRANGEMSRYLMGLQGLAAQADITGKWLQNAMQDLEVRAAREQAPLRRHMLETQAMMGDILLQNTQDRLPLELANLAAQGRISEEQAQRDEALTPILIEELYPLMGPEALVKVMGSLADIERTQASTGQIEAETQRVGLETEIKRALKPYIMDEAQLGNASARITNRMKDIQVGILEAQTEAGAGRFGGRTDEDLKKERLDIVRLRDAARDNAADLLEPEKGITGERPAWGFTVDEMLDVAQNGREVKDPASGKTVRVRDDRITAYAAQYLDHEEALSEIEDELARRGVRGFEPVDSGETTFPGDLSMTVYPEGAQRSGTAIGRSTRRDGTSIGRSMAPDVGARSQLPPWLGNLATGVGILGDLGNRPGEFARQNVGRGARAVGELGRQSISLAEAASKRAQDAAKAEERRRRQGR